MQQESIPENSDYYGLDKAVIDKDKCLMCNLCYDSCRFDAINNDDGYKVNIYDCEGCGVCKAVDVYKRQGPFDPKDLVRILKIASENEADLVTFDGAGGGTGNSPVKMMNEWGMPTLYLESMLYNICLLYTSRCV